MDKIAWVLLPLVVVVGVLAVLAWRGRLPPRHTLNVWFSLLLMLYLLGTAGLGIFWVANQHLPVFDWHYLFGYATVLLLCVHLAFNLRIVVQHFRRRRREPGVPRAVVAGVVPGVLPGRRPAISALGLLGAGAALGGAFWLGLRHGRTELRIEAGSATGSASRHDTALALIEQFHEFSAHSRLGVFRRAPGTDWGDPPAPFKTYPGRPRVALPAAWRREADATASDGQALATLLWMVAGVSEQRGPIAFRTSPSSGALFSTELYLHAMSLDGIAPGLWHYDARGHGLESLPGAAPTIAQTITQTIAPPPGARAAIIATAVFRRSGHKYRDRSYRYVLADLGHALENLRVVAQALGLAVRFEAAFDDAPWSHALALDAAEEGVLMLAWLLPGDAQATALTEAPREAHPRWTLPLPQDGAPLGVTDAVHRATSLRSAPDDAQSKPTSVSAAVSPMASRHSVLLPQAPMAPFDVLATLATRRSQRRYRRDAMSLPALAALLAAMVAPVPVLSGAVRIHLVAHAVTGLAAGAWRYESATQRLHAHGEPIADRDVPALRRRSRAAGLDQDTIGDAAVVVVLAIDRAAFAADPAGPARGYRHAFLEVGRVGERLYLAAPTLGLGVCAVGAFYDDEAAALVGVDPAKEWVLHFASVGPV
ncbi:MAG: SagB family peptide dehydrogenase [Rubrivivax sp.]|nr:SagB family peptide dehydrogenase [Rubrivivax sp.]